MLHLMTARTPAPRIEYRTVTLDIDRFECLDYTEDDWTVRRFEIAEHAARLGLRSEKDGRVFPASIVDTAVALLTGGIGELAVVWGPGTPRETRMYHTLDERDPAWTQVTLRKAVLVGFTDRQARMVFDAVTAIVPMHNPFAGFEALA